MNWDEDHEQVRMLQASSIEPLEGDATIGVLYLVTTDAEDEKSEEVIYDFAINRAGATELRDALNKFIDGN